MRLAFVIVAALVIGCEEPKGTTVPGAPGAAPAAAAGAWTNTSEPAWTKAAATQPSEQAEADRARGTLRSSFQSSLFSRIMIDPNKIIADEMKWRALPEKQQESMLRDASAFFRATGHGDRVEVWAVNPDRGLAMYTPADGFRIVPVLNR